MKKITVITVIVISLAFLSALMVFSKGAEADKPLIFDHQFHAVEIGISCSDCHNGIENLGAGGRAMPDHDVCMSCHDVEDDAACGNCHRQADSPMSIPPLEGRYEGFAHSAHTKFNCDKCHRLMEGAQIGIPVMTDCQTCHLRKNGPVECGDCHRGESPLPVTHRLASWNQDHGLEAAARSGECFACHQQNDCDECHQGENIYGKPHPPGWIFNHFLEASFGGECIVCHETREKCSACHRAMIPAPHTFGPAYANSDEGGEHKQQAADFIEVCISCHDVGNADPTCSRCH